jgi:hypothetical protein
MNAKQRYRRRRRAHGKEYVCYYNDGKTGMRMVASVVGQKTVAFRESHVQLRAAPIFARVS